MDIRLVLTMNCRRVNMKVDLVLRFVDLLKGNRERESVGREIDEVM